jgi:toxin ParE1/3/4
MTFAVLLTVDAERDLLDLHRYVAANDGPVHAGCLLTNLEKIITGPDTMPGRGHCPPELERIGVLEFRELFFKPYRIIYGIDGTDVIVHCILDGRREMLDLLQERLLR